MGTPSAVAVYARISSDQDGTALGVGRQVADCRRLADELGWVVAEDYIDNDISAFGGKRRPAYERMLADVGDGLRDAVIVYHADRLTRRPIELEQFLEVVGGAGVRHVRFVAGGNIDVADGDGLLVLRMLSAVAANESASKGRRVRRKLDEVAASGQPHGGSIRPFGFDHDKITVRPDEAEAIRTLVARFLAGESLRSLATWADNEGIKTSTGGPWRSSSLRSLISSGRIAGLRTHRGEVIGPAVWEAIITPADRDRVLARLSEQARTGRRTARKYLLSGLLRCGKCGNRLFSAARTDSRRYVCLSGPDHGGCGGITVAAERVEELITAAVLLRLDTDELADSLAGRAAADAQAAAVAEALAVDRGRLDELAALYGTSQIGAREWLAARNPIEARIEDNQRRLARMTHSDALAGLVGNGEALSAQWADLALTRQHAIIAAVMDHAVINPTTQPGGRRFDHRRVDPAWRV